MTDYFALFDLPRGPCLDAEALKDEFHRRSARAHPDAGGEPEQFARLNAAYQVLRDPVARLRHLLELEAPEELARASQVPAALGDAFLRIAAVRQSAGSFLAQWRAATSSLSRALLASDRVMHERTLDDLLRELEAARTQALSALADGDWRTSLPDLAQRAAELSYLQKWLEQLRETRLQFDLVQN